MSNVEPPGPSIPTNSSIPPVSEDSILNWVGSRNLREGHSYFESQAIIDPRRQGKAIRAQCQGSMPLPYRLQAVIGPRGVVEADCSCPVGSGGRCKHVGALLLAWLHRPDDFRVAADFETDLEQRSKPELIALIKQMLQIQPDLETLLDATSPSAARGGVPVIMENYRRQVSAAFRRAGDDWYAMRSVPRDIGITLSAGDGFLALSDHGNASIVYQAVAQGIIEHYEMVQDDDGELCETVDRCVEGLDDCLASMELDPAARKNVLQTLCNIYLFNIDYGGGETAVTAPDAILERATSEEKSDIASRIREEMPQGNGWSGRYRRKAFGRFLLDLEDADSSDGSFLEICRESSLLPELADKLLSLGRLEEAAAEAETADDYDLLAIADIFHQNGCSQRIEPLLASRIATDRSHRLLDWLKERHKERGELPQALELAKRKLEGNLSRASYLAGYVEARQLAQRLGVWEELRPQLLGQWSADGEFALLTEIHLEEGELDLALKSVKQGAVPSFPGGEQLLRVAEAVSATHPQDALEIYCQQAERLINLRGRDNYQQACKHLVKVRDLYFRLSQESNWANFIAQLRDQYRRLRALQEELGNAGL